MPGTVTDPVREDIKREHTEYASESVHTGLLFCCSVIQWCLTLCNPMDCSTPGFPFLPYLLEFAQTHVHWVGDAIQPSYTLLPPSLLALNLFQHQDLFQWIDSASGGQSIGASFLASVFPEYSGLISSRTDWFDLLAIQESSPAPQFETINSSALSLLYGPALISIHATGKTQPWVYRPLLTKWCFCFLIGCLGLS